MAAFVARLVGALALVVVAVVVLLHVLLGALHAMLPPIIVTAVLVWILRSALTGRR
jgi:hypothetical protein